MMAKQLVKPPQLASDVYEELKAKASQLVSSSNIEALHLKVDAEAKELKHLEEVVESLSSAMGKVGAVEGELKEDNQCIKEEVQKLEKAVEEARKDVQKHDTCVSMLNEGASKVESTWDEVKEKATAHFVSLIATSRERLLTANPSLPADEPLDLNTLRDRKAALQAVLSGEAEEAPHICYPEVAVFAQKSDKLCRILSTLKQIDEEEEALCTSTTHSYSDRYTRLTRHHNAIDELCRDAAISEKLGSALLASGENCREATKTARVEATNVSEVMAVTHDLQRQSEEGDAKVAANKQTVEALQADVSKGREAVAALQGKVSGGMGKLEALQRLIEEVQEQHRTALVDIEAKTKLLQQLVSQHVSVTKDAKERVNGLKRDLAEEEARKTALKKEIEKKVALGLGSVVASKKAEADNAKEVAEYFLQQQRSLEFVDMQLGDVYAGISLTDEQLAGVERIVEKYTTTLQQESNKKEKHLKEQMASITRGIETTFENSDEYTVALRAMQQEIDALCH